MGLLTQLLWGQFTYPQVSEQVDEDIHYSFEQADALYEENVNEVMENMTSETFSSAADTGWEVQADVLKENIYSGALLMFLRYYSEKNP